MTPPDAAGAQVLVDDVGSFRHLRLNRPKALNSLTLDMVLALRAALEAAGRDDAVLGVVLSGEGARGLCAGGDVKALHDSGRSGSSLAATFWREEYPLDAAIHRFPKPYLAFMDGLVMGGGVGLSAHGSNRIVTETTRFAMPETGIGYFPDVGTTWLLSRGPGELGTYIGLTGEFLTGADVIAAGLADVMMPSADFPALLAALAALGKAGAAHVGEVLARFAYAPPPSALARHEGAIDRCFAGDTVEGILVALEAERTAFSRRTLAILRTRSPTSLKLALRLLRLGRASASLEDCLEREFTASLRTLENPDFYEGVRAAVIDKDRNPAWSAREPAAVPGAAVDRFLERPPGVPRLFGVSREREE